jgi:hypothetical protein
MHQQENPILHDDIGKDGVIRSIQRSPMTLPRSMVPACLHPVQDAHTGGSLKQMSSIFPDLRQLMKLPNRDRHSPLFVHLFPSVCVPF